MKDRIIQSRNPRVSFDRDELEYMKGLVDKDIGKGKFDHKKMLFKLTIYKKLEEAR